MNFHPGQKIRMKEECGGHIRKGEICILHWGIQDGRYKNDLWAWGQESECGCKSNWQLIGKEVSMKDIKYGIKYDQDEDPTEYFETKKEAEKRIGELIEDSAVSNIYLFGISNVLKVKVPKGFELVKE